MRRNEVGGLGDAVDHTAAAAAPEQQGIGAFEHFDPFDVIERAIVLRIVADAVEVEIGSRRLTADRDLIAVALALIENDTRDIAQRIIELFEPLIVEPLAPQRRDTLRRIEQRGAGLDA